MHETLTIFLLILLIAAAVGLAAKRLRVHYNIALVLTGAAVGAAQAIPPVRLDPAVVLHVFLPILLLEAALSTDSRRLRENLTPVSLLAVPGMMVTVFIAGCVLRYGTRLPWTSALLLGSILAATDTIAVIATFRKVQVPHRLQAIVESESLFNDGTALVAFSTVLAAAQQGRFDPGRGLLDLLWVTAAGMAVGAGVGYVASQLMRRTEDHLMEIMVTVLVAYASSLLSEELHASPVLAVVAAGLVVGSVGWQGLHATLTVQGLTLGPLIRGMGVGQRGETEQRVEKEQGQLLAARAGQAELDRLRTIGLLPLGLFQRMRAASQGVIVRSERQIQDILAIHSQEERGTRTRCGVTSSPWRRARSTTPRSRGSSARGPLPS
jgi:NhaP-type Na+/H+ or K+/H+ antiporter